MTRSGNWDDIEALSDGGEDDITPEQQLQLTTATSQVRSILGPENESGISDQEISDTVWNNYFDVEKSLDELRRVFRQGNYARINLCADTQARKAAIAARKGELFAHSS